MDHRIRGGDVGGNTPRGFSSALCGGPGLPSPVPRRRRGESPWFSSMGLGVQPRTGRAWRPLGPLEAGPRPRPSGSRPLGLDRRAARTSATTRTHRPDSGAGDATPAAVVGHSMGGVVALRLAVEPPTSRPWRWSSRPASRPTSVGRRRSCAHRPPEACAPRGWFRHYIAPSRLWGADLRVLGGGAARDLTAEAVLGFLEGGRDATTSHGLGGSRSRRPASRPRPRDLPGARSLGLARPDGAARGRLRIRTTARAPVRVIAGAGHLLIGERPEECAAIIEDFLDRVGEVDELPLEENSWAIRSASARTPIVSVA